MSVTLCGKCLKEVCSCRSMLRKGQEVRCISSPLPESRHLIGRVGIVLEDADSKGLAQARFKHGTIYVDAAMVEILTERVEGVSHVSDAFAYTFGPPKVTFGRQEPEAWDPLGQMNNDRRAGFQRIKQLLSEGKIVIR